MFDHGHLGDNVRVDARCLPTPPAARPAILDWVDAWLGDLFDGPAQGSAVRGGQSAADRALAAFDVAGYAAARNEVWPEERRGASRLSPYIRHGLLPLPEVWNAVGDGPAQDVEKFRDELLWQEYARHVYARLGSATRRSLRFSVPERGGNGRPWQTSARCVEAAWNELADQGWITNQQRMWLASHWTVRHGHGWRDGEDLMFRHLLDGSRAANRVGWQWTVGALTGRPYGFARSQVEHRAPGLCSDCPHRRDCPIEHWPDPVVPTATEAPDPRLKRGDIDIDDRQPHVTGRPDAVWLTAESLGDGDPALMAHQDLPAVFVFDAPLLQRLRLSGRRLVFLAETLADLAERRPIEVWLGDPVRVLDGRRVAATVTPVPGWNRRARLIDPVARYPWRWLIEPGTGPVGSFTAWRKAR